MGDTLAAQDGKVESLKRMALDAGKRITILNRRIMNQRRELRHLNKKYTKQLGYFSALADQYTKLYSANDALDYERMLVRVILILSGAVGFLVWRLTRG